MAIQIDENVIKRVLEELSDPVIQPNLTTLLDGTSGGVVAIRDGYTLKQLPGKEKTARRHIFHDLGSFAAWLNRHAKNRAQQVEILMEDTKVIADLAPSDQHSDLVTCMLIPHPMIQAWDRVFGKGPMTQKEFHNFIRGNMEAFPEKEGKGNIGEVLASSLLRLSVTNAKDLTAEMDERGFYHLSGGSNKSTVSNAIPPRFSIEIPVYIGVCDPSKPETELKYRIEILLSIGIQDTSVSFYLSCPSLPLVYHQARLDARAWLEHLLDDEFLVGLGELQGEVVPVMIA